MKETGIIKEIFEVHVVSLKFKKREFVVMLPKGDDRPRNEPITFVLANEKCNLLNYFTEGEEVIVYFNIRGREFHDIDRMRMRYFNTLECWRIEKVK